MEILRGFCSTFRPGPERAQAVDEISQRLGIPGGEVKSALDGGETHLNAAAVAAVLALVRGRLQLDRWPAVSRDRGPVVGLEVPEPAPGPFRG